MFLSNARVHHNGGSFSIRKPTAFTITTHHRKKLCGISHKIVISYHWPNCKSLNRRQSRHRESHPSPSSMSSSRVCRARRAASRDIWRIIIVRIAHEGITTMTSRAFAMSRAIDPLVPYIPRVTVAWAPTQYMRNSIRSMIISSSVSHTSFASTVAKPAAEEAARRRRETIRNIWILASQATHHCPAIIIEKCRKVAVYELEAHTRSQAISITPIITLECCKRAPAHKTFRIEANIWCHQSPTQRIWRLATINHLRTIQARHWWRSDFSTRAKIPDDRVTAHHRNRQSTKALITHHLRLISPDRAALCRRLAADRRDAHTYSSERIQSMAMAAMIRCMKSTSSRWRIRPYRDEGIRLRRKID